jgi:hypothetical protein
MVMLVDRPGSCGASFALSPRRVAAALAAPSRSLTAALVFVAAAAAATTVVLDLEGVGDRSDVKNYSGGGGRRAAKNYGITFGDGPRWTPMSGRSAFFATEPSPSTAARFGGDPNYSFVTVRGGFTKLSFQCSSLLDMSINGVRRTEPGGGALAASFVPTTGQCPAEAGRGPPPLLRFGGRQQIAQWQQQRAETQGEIGRAIRRQPLSLGREHCQQEQKGSQAGVPYRTASAATATETAAPTTLLR